MIWFGLCGFRTTGRCDGGLIQSQAVIFEKGGEKMADIASITIDEEYGQILVPLEIGQKLNLKNFDWLKVNVLTNKIVLSISREEVDDELIEALIHEGIIIDPK